jgi:hypothetical protein
VLDLGLRESERTAFHAALTGSYRARTTLEVLDRDEAVLDTIEDAVLSGSVDIDTKSIPDRTLQVTFADQGRRFHFAPGGAADSAMFADNMIRARRQYWVGVLDTWVDVPLFTGPVETVSRDAGTVSVTAKGKESRLIEPEPAWRPQHHARGKRVTDAIHDILAESGERRFDIPKRPARLKKPVSLGRHTEPWKVVRRLADSIDRQVFYDARGRVRLRHAGAHAVWRFTTTGNVVGALPKRAFDLTEMRNTVEVLGPEEPGKKTRLRYVATPPKGNPLSPWSLARNGKPRFIVETIELDHAKDMAVLRSRGDRELDDLLRSALTLDFEAMVVPTLEPGDMVALVEDGERTAFRLRRFTIPLTGEAMTVGENRRPKVRGKR